MVLPHLLERFTIPEIEVFCAILVKTPAISLGVKKSRTSSEFDNLKSEVGIVKFLWLYRE